MTDYKISIIIPTYNAENYLEKCINSVINQTFGFENIELLLIDDNSTDKTKEIIKDFSNRYDNVVAILNDENSGSPSKPRNIGIDHASADYIMFMDNDDFICPDMCEKMYSSIIKEQVDVVSCGHMVAYNDEPPMNRDSFLDNEETFIKVKSVKEYEKIMTPGVTMIIWNKIIKRDLIKDNDIKFPEKVLYEDVAFMSQVFLKANGIVLINDYWGYVYCIRTEGDNLSTSQDYTEKNLIKQLAGLKVLFNILDKYESKYSSLECGMLTGWTKLFILTNPPDNHKRQIFEDAKDVYKHYSLFGRIENISLPLNMFINIFMKIFSSNTSIGIFLINFYNKLKDLGIAKALY